MWQSERSEKLSLHIKPRGHVIPIITIFCCSIRPTFSVMCGLSCFLFMVVVVHVSVLFLFFTTDIHTFIYFTLFLKGFFT